MLFINNVDIEEGKEISTYINEFIAKTKGDVAVDYTKLFITSARSNLLLALLLWFAGLTVIGIFVVYAVVTIRGFTLGFSISSIIATLGAKQGMIFIFSSMLPQNIIFIPILFALAISGIRLYKSIMKEKTRENIKIEILRHTIFSAMLSVALILASLIEAYISTSLFMLTLKIL